MQCERGRTFHKDMNGCLDFQERNKDTGAASTEYTVFDICGTDLIRLYINKHF